jgi:hypothetical protein
MSHSLVVLTLCGSKVQKTSFCIRQEEEEEEKPETNKERKKNMASVELLPGSPQSITITTPCNPGFVTLNPKPKP